MKDAYELPITTTAAAGDAFNRALRSFTGYDADVVDRTQAVLQADPGFALGHCLWGYVMMLAYSQAAVPVAADACRAAAQHAAGATPREQAHVRALQRWIAGDLDGALREWELILAAWPRDVLALRLCHANYFWLGRQAEMRASLERVAPHWAEDSGFTRMPRVFPGRNGRLCRGGAHGAPRGGARPDRSLGRARGGARARDAAPARRRPRLAGRPGAALERQGRFPAPPVVAPGDVPPRAARVRRGARALRPAASATWRRRWSRRCPTSTSTCRTPPRCCCAWSCAACTSARAGKSSPTRRRRASATACRPGRCRTG